MALDDNIWYAVNQTRIITEPKQTIETFGITRIRYYIVSELLDLPEKIRIQEGVIISEKPTIITPQHFAQQLINGFGSEAKAYADWLTKHGDLIKILQYGLQLRKEEIKEETVSGTLSEVLGRVREIADKSRDLTTVIQGVDEMWEISLMKFMEYYISRSVARNYHDIYNQRQQLEQQAKADLTRSIEEEFYQARGKKQKIIDLGAKLQDLGFFEKYEDRLYALLRECN